MKRVIVAITFLVLSFITHAQGTQWADMGRNYQGVLNQAGNQNKLACFVVYADWSRQSEVLLNRVMTFREVGDFYNSHFVNIKINVGQSEGRHFISRYNVRSIPAIVFVSPKGQLVRIANNKGLNSYKAVLKAARLALNYPGEEEWAFYQRKYESGKRDWYFLEEYIEERLIETGLPTPYELVLEYVNALPRKM